MSVLRICFCCLRGRRSWWRGEGSRFHEGFGEDVAVAGSEGDAAESGERGGDVGGRDGLEVLAGLDPEAHQQNGDVLVIIVGDAVTGAVRARLSGRSAVKEPVGLWQDE